MKILGHREVIQHQQTGSPLKLPCELGWINSRRDWRFVEEWDQVSELSGKPDHQDSAEYAEISVDRWTRLRERKECALSLEDACERVASAPRTEFGFCIVLRMKDPRTSGVIGFAYVRRLWSGNLCLEFLGKVAPPKTASVGVQLLNGLAYCARHLKSAEIWGECTESSKPFYRETKTDLLKESLEESRAKGFSVRGWQMPGDIEDRFSFGAQEVKLLGSALTPEGGAFDGETKGP